MTELEQGRTYHGFTVEKTDQIPEADARAYVMRHASGARLLYLSCPDENKAFCCGFKTPPADDTGVFHILEHSVLCGSARFPVKEPFVDLIKSSMQTFLNALTYPDKTCYPVASTNEQDLLNLMDVYLDAVYHPAIYSKEAIFRQEGWHYEVDAADPEHSPLTVNGVVYNEMKGALSDPAGVLDDELMAALYPDTAYARESGGDPRHIPELTYERFLDTHARHYAAPNSYMVLYGDFPDVCRELAFIDERHLSRAPERSGAGAPNPLAEQAPVTCDLRVREMATTPDNALVGAGYVIGSALDRERVIAADVLFEALLGSNEAPVKRALLDAGLGGDVQSYTNTACLQPCEVVILRSAKPGAAEEFRRVLEGACAKLVSDGVPTERLEAVISSNEYDLRQRDYGTADGVVLALDALSTWIYDDDAATLALHYEDVYAGLRAKLGTGYFEKLLNELVCSSSHRALVELRPVESDSDDEAARLERVRAQMTGEQLRGIADDQAALRAAQEAEDSPEAKATLPRLRVSDIGPARPDPDLVVDTTAPICCLKHPISTNRLAYALEYFDLECVGYRELPYVSILCRLLGQLGCERLSAAELDNELTSRLGFLTFSTSIYQTPRAQLNRPKLVVAAGALSEKIDALAELPAEVWRTTRFDDTEKIRDVLTQTRIAMEQDFINSGHRCAIARAMSYTTTAGVAREMLSGTDFYRFLRDLLDHYDERAEELARTLAELRDRIFVSDGAFSGFTGSEEDYRRYWEAAGSLGLEPRAGKPADLLVPVPEPHWEAFAIPSDVSYSAQAADPRLLRLATDGAWSVAANAVSFDYLWNEVRVKGGAYGCGLRSAAARQLSFYSYRDPRIDRTLERFAGAGKWLSGFDPDPEAFEGFIISTVSAVDAPSKPYATARRQDGEYFSGRGAHWQARQREQMLACTPERLRAIGRELDRVAADMPACVFGSKEIIEASDRDWEVVDLLG